MCSIDWCAFTWQAFATIFTGVAATGGAVLIGSRQLLINREQVRVAEGQARIASAQAMTARMAQRSSLFDKRYAIYTSIQDYHRNSMSSIVDDSTDFSSAGLHTALDKAKFLFPIAVREAIIRALDAADDYAETTIDLRDNGAFESLNDPRRKVRSEKRKVARSRLTELTEAMGDEMRLYTDVMIPEFSAPKA